MIIFLCIRTQKIKKYIILILLPGPINKYPLSLYMGRKNNKNRKQQYRKVNVITPSTEKIIEEPIIEKPIINNVNKIEIIDDYMNKLPAIVDTVIEVPDGSVGYGSSCVIF